LMKKMKKHVLLNNQNYILKDQVCLFLFFLSFSNCIFQEFDKITKKLMNIIQELVKKFKVFVLINKFHQIYHHQFSLDQPMENKMSSLHQLRVVHVNCFILFLKKKRTSFCCSS
jgi:hypothetical protein